MVDLHVGRVALRARVPAAPERWRRRLIDLTESGLERALRPRIAALLGARGLGSEAAVYVRRVGVRLRLRGAVADARVVEAWAEAIGRELARQCAEIPGASAGWTESVALFPDASAADLAWVARRLLDLPEAWWERSVSATRRPGEALADVAWRTPARLGPALVSLHRARRVPWEQVVAPADAALALAVLARAADAAEHAARGRGEGAPTERLDEAATALSQAPIPALEGVTEPALRRLLAAALMLTRALGPEPAAAEGATESSPSRAPPAPEEPASPAARRAPGEPWPLYLTGLAFLVRPLLRGPVAARLPTEQWPALVRGTMEAALARLLAGLRPELGALVRAQHEELIAVLSGGGEPGDPTDGERALEALLDGLPPALDLTLHRGPLAPERRALADLVLQQAPPGLGALALRPGRLSAGRGWADLFLPLATVDPALRMGGWDLDPGWLPAVGRVIRFHYEGEP